MGISFRLHVLMTRKFTFPLSTSKSLHPFSQMARVNGEHSQPKWSARHCHENHDLLTINHATRLTCILTALHHFAVVAIDSLQIL